MVFGMIDFWNANQFGIPTPQNLEPGYDVLKLTNETLVGGGGGATTYTYIYIYMHAHSNRCRIKSNRLILDRVSLSKGSYFACSHSQNKTKHGL